MYRETNQSVVNAYFESINIEYHKLSEIPKLVVEDVIDMEEKRNSGKLMNWKGDPGTCTLDYNVKKFNQDDLDQLTLHIRGALEDEGLKVQSIKITGNLQGAPHRSSGASPTYITVKLKIKSNY